MFGLVAEPGATDEISRQGRRDVIIVTEAFEQEARNSRWPILAYARKGRRRSGSDGIAAQSKGTFVPRLEALVHAQGSSKATMVELRGFEPLTPSMPWKCATSCATAPCGIHHTAAPVTGVAATPESLAPPAQCARAALRRWRQQPRRRQRRQSTLRRWRHR